MECETYTYDEDVKVREFREKHQDSGFFGQGAFHVATENADQHYTSNSLDVAIGGFSVINNSSNKYFVMFKKDGKHYITLKKIDKQIKPITTLEFNTIEETMETAMCWFNGTYFRNKKLKRILKLIC